MTLGARIRVFAKQHSGNVDAFAKAVGVHGVQMAKYVNDTSKPGLEVLQRLAGAGVSVHWLVTGEGPMDAPRDSRYDRATIDACARIVEEMTRAAITEIHMLLDATPAASDEATLIDDRDIGLDSPNNRPIEELTRKRKGKEAV